LTLASCQGLLYSYQLPAPTNGTRPTPSPAETAGRQLLNRLLNGPVNDLEPAPVAAVPVVDADLNAGQREAVTRALSTPDVCLIQGLPGTGKSRVITEIVTQAAAQGLRVLLLAPGAAAIDQVLQAAGSRDTVCALRCLGRDESAGALPPAIRALTFPERVRRLSEQTLRQVRSTLADEEERCRRCRQDEAVWPRLEDLAGQQRRLGEETAAVARERTACPAQVELEAAGRADAEANRQADTATQQPDGTPGEVSPGRSFAAALALATRTHQETLARLDASRAEAQRRMAERRRELDERAPELEALRPLAEAKEKGRAWTFAWWRATFRGKVIARLAALEDQQKETRLALAGLEDEIRGLEEERTAAESAFRAERSSLIGAEIARRQAELDGRQAALRREQEELQGRWQVACRELAGGTPPADPMTPDAVQAAREAWRQQLAQEEQRLAFTREWAGYLQEAAGTLAARFPGYVNLVGATVAGLAGDPHFGAQATAAVPFDLLVVDEAEQVTEAEFLKVARRARRWILVGEPAWEAGNTRGRAEGAKPGAPIPPRGRLATSLFHKIWRHLHGDPRRLPYAWVREGDRLCCRLRPLAEEQRQRLETEHVVDFPEIELRILVVPRVQPLLAEVVFPPSMSIQAAKEYIYKELEELPVQAAGHSLRWVEEDGRLVLDLADAHPAGGTWVSLEPGVRELVAGPAGAEGGWLTCRLEFDPAAGWLQPRAEDWVRRYLGLRDTGRTIHLDVPQRMRSSLAAFLADLLFEGGYRIATGVETAAPRTPGRAAPVEFVCVPGAAAASPPRRPESRHRARGNGARVAAPPAPRTARGGAGLELDLASPRHVDRLPSELRPGLPGQGFVNYLEAQAVVRALEDLVAEGGPNPSALVLALYPAQAELIRRLIRQSPCLGAAARLDVDVPSACRHREAAVVLVSLTRSHSHRAVSYGDGPQALALALTRAQARLILFGDPGTLARRSQWQGALDHLDEAAADRERQLVARLLGYLQGQGRHPEAFHLHEGSGA
jgi:hypothetical protein